MSEVRCNFQQNINESRPANGSLSIQFTAGAIIWIFDRKDGRGKQIDRNLFDLCRNWPPKFLCNECALCTSRPSNFLKLKRPTSLFSCDQNITNILQIATLADTLFVEDSNNLILPTWTDPIYPDVLDAVKVKAYELFTYTRYMTRIRGGPLLTVILQQMVQKQNGPLSRNFAIYSAHDTTLGNLMKALNVINQTTPTPDYGATLAFELHCGIVDECIINVSHLPKFYRRSVYS